MSWEPFPVALRQVHGADDGTLRLSVVFWREVLLGGGVETTIRSVVPALDRLCAVMAARAKLREDQRDVSA